MCLVINQDKHKYASYFKPIKLKEDLSVYKMITVLDSVTKPMFYTPFVKMPVIFDNKGICITDAYLKEEFITTHPEKTRNSYHSFIDLDECRNFTKYCNTCRNGTSTPSIREIILKAIIPKGSYVYYGEDGDIASNQLIIKLEIVDLNDN